MNAERTIEVGIDVTCFVIKMLVVVCAAVVVISIEAFCAVG